jgi:hypothetical protein
VVSNQTTLSGSIGLQVRCFRSVATRRHGTTLLPTAVLCCTFHVEQMEGSEQVEGHAQHGKPTVSTATLRKSTLAR